jgi:hypothetical protein
MLRDTLLHFGLEQCGVVLVFAGFKICPHVQHRWIRRGIIVACDLALAYACVRLIG